ncbi:hypothetical protein Pelo_3165 [Pelomyxa schiedti]|nr:hypothetical protein Pelo_3165 [Pelomyxa schiedti]
MWQRKYTCICSTETKEESHKDQDSDLNPGTFGSGLAGCEEKGKAENVYSDGIFPGHGAFLIKHISEDLFKATIGNLAPKEETTFSPPEEPSTSSVWDDIVTMAVTIQNRTPITGK